MLFVARSYSFAHRESPACRRPSYSCIQAKTYFGGSLLSWRKPTLMAKAYYYGECLLLWRKPTLMAKAYSHGESLLFWTWCNNPDFTKIKKFVFGVNCLIV